MNTILKKLISGVLAVVMMFTCFPVAAIAATATTESDNSVELNDGYLSVSVSKENGGFLVDTLIGNQLKESDDGKNLLYPSEGYDTSFTSFQVTRTDGTVEEYIFGRQYGFLGIYTSAVETKIQGSSIVSTWSVKDLTITQTLSFVDETNPQHGQVDISYDVTTTADDVANVKARIMLDTALGSQDYGFYQLHSKNGGYNLVQKETVVGSDAYDSVLMSITNDGASPVIGYTINAVVDGTEQKPYQVAFGHWANLANTVFGFAPDATRPPFNSPYDGNYMTADSAYALYYDLGGINKGESAGVSTYYGVYSNVTVSADERVAINFTQLPSSMKVKDGSTLESASYYSQVEGGYDGDIEVRMVVENLTADPLTDLTVLVKTMNNVYTYTGDYPAETSKSEGEYRTTITRINADDTTSLNLFFNITPLSFSEYRYFEIEIYSGSKLSEQNLLGSKGFYLLCPSVLGEEVSFNSTNPQTIYVEGSRTLYISGENFKLLQDTSAYVAYLRPVEQQESNAMRKARAGVQKASVIPGTNIVINQGENTMNVLVENALEPGVYELVLDWVEDEKGETTSQMLLVRVTDDPSFKMPTYGIVTVEQTAEYTPDDPTYQIGIYNTEEEYKAVWDEIERASGGSRCAALNVLLEFRGDFTMVRDEKSGALSLTATSVENPDGTVSGSINISNAIEVQGGYVTVRVENPGKENQCIYTDIDGHVITSGARTTIWDGVCALTPIANGEINGLMQYYEDGTVAHTIEDITKVANTISLLWPAAAGTAQTICGMFFELRYCEFGTIATEYCDKDKPIPNDTPRHRVVAFSAILDPSFLLPTDFLMSDRELSSMDLAQRTLAKKNYTAEQLVEIDRKYKADTDKWLAAQGGTLTLVVENILFGDNRFLGFDASLEVGIPSYFANVGGIEGTLSLAVWMLNPADDTLWEIGVDGAIDLELFFVEATMVLKAIEGVPHPDELYLYVGGFTPGLNVDSYGVFWITGAGGGISDLYEAVIGKSKYSPFSATLEGGFSLFQMLFSRLKVTVGGRHIEAQIKDLGFNKGYSAASNVPQSGIHGEADILTIIPSMGFSAYWYPKFKLSAHVNLNILSIIDGGGYIILEKNTEEDRMFFEAMATATVKTPNIPLVGVIELAGVDVGIDLERIYGALHVLKMDFGMCYYYGSDVEFSMGKYDVPGPTLLSAKVGELSTGEPVILAFGTNITQVASSEPGVQLLGTVSRLDNTKPSIVSATDRMHHAFTLGDYDDGDLALTVVYPADTLEQARAIAMGGPFNDGLTLISGADGHTYELQWLDVTGVLDPEKANSANALLNYNEETKEASVTISFTNREDFEAAWQLTSAEPCELVLYSLTRLADVESVSFHSGNGIVSWTGSQLADFDKLTIAAIAADGTMYPLYDTEDTNVITSGSARVSFPDSVPTGEYTIQIIAKDEEGNVSEVEESASRWAYVNPLQPGKPAVSNVRLGGDYRINVDVQKTGNLSFTGYTTVIEQSADGGSTWVETDFAQQEFTPDTATLSVGGHYTSTNFIRYTTKDNTHITDEAYQAMSEEEKKDITVETISYPSYAAMSEEERAAVCVLSRETGLEAGVLYRVRVNAYAVTENDEVIYSESACSDPVTMVEPDPAQVTVTGLNAKKLEEDGYNGETLNRDVYTAREVSVNLTADQAAHVVWKLDNGSVSGELELTQNTAAPLTLSGLNQGVHVLKLFITNENGDESTAQYTFRVDSEPPKLQISSPQTGSFFAGTVTVTGISEAGSVIHVLVEGVPYTTYEVPATVHLDGGAAIVEGGHFAIDVMLDSTVYEQTITVYAEDEAGNASRAYDLVLVNDIVAKLDSELAIYFDGQDVTGQTIPGGSEGVLELRYVQRDENGLPVRSVTVPADSTQGSLCYWDTYIVAGYGEVTRDQGIFLKTSADVNGMLTVTVDKQQVSAVLGGNATAPREYYTVTLPENPEGYTVTTEDPVKLKHLASFEFRVTVSEGYNGDSMKVFANNVELTAADGVYTIANITADQKVTVTGVADITAPEVEVEVEGNTWREFLHTITFGLFFSKTVDAKITAADSGSGINSKYILVSSEPIAMEELETASWQAYTDPVKLEPDGEYIVYAKVVDNAGNIRYASSDGLVLDATAPSVTGIVDGGVYEGDVTFTVSDRYIASVTVNGEEVTGDVFTLHPAEGAQTIVVKDRAGNTTTLTVTVNRIPDTTAPEVSIRVRDNFWSKLLDTITFGLFFDTHEEAVIEAADDDSGVKEISYLIVSESVAAEELAGAAWTVYTGPVKLDADGRYIIYAKVVDNEGNTCFASSDGLVIDTLAPKVTGITDGGVYEGDVTFTVEDANLESITINGEEVTGDVFTLHPAEGVQTVVIVDKAGNTTTLTVTVNEIPDTTAPEVSIALGGRTWSKLVESVTFDLFFRTNEEFVIAAADDDSGVKEISYLIVSEPVAAEELAGAAWTVYTGPVKLDADGRYIIYAKVVDNEGNTCFASSDGLVIDTLAPKVTGITDGGVYEGDVTFTVEDANLESITINGEEVTGDVFTLHPAEGVQTVVIVDKAGNTTTLTVTVNRIPDTTAPEVSIRVRDNFWSKLLDTITFGLFFDTHEEAVIEAADDDSGVKEISYLIVSESVAAEELAGAAWTVYTGPVKLDADGRYIIYAKVVDNEGNTCFASSDGLVIDTLAPKVTGITDGGVYEGDVTFTVEDANLESITINGEEVTGDVFTLHPAEGVQTVVIVDKAGNTTTLTVTVNEIPDTTAPEVTIRVRDYTWSELTPLDLIFDTREEAVIEASDADSGLNGVYYLVSRDPVALDDLATAGWHEYTEPVKLDSDGRYIVYAMAVDNAGNVRYVNTTGLVIDTVAPSVTGITDGGVYEGDVTFTVYDENIESVTINGEKVTGDVFTLHPAEGVQTIVIVDKAGHVTTVRVTVNEAPEPEKPGCDGTGDCPTGQYPDLDSSAWYHDYTDYVIENGLMIGYEDGTFRPGDKLNRAMLLQILYNLEGRPAVTGKVSYTDTKDNTWYADAIVWGTENSIINGYGNGQFGPGDPVTREQMATILYRYSAMKGYSLTEGNYNHFSDKDTVSGYAQAAMRWAVGNGLLSGMGDGTLCPQNHTLRAEFAAMFQRFCEVIAK